MTMHQEISRGEVARRSKLRTQPLFPRCNRYRASMSTTEQPQRDLLTTAETAAELGVSRGTVYRWIEAGELPHVRLGRGPCAPIRVARDELHNWARRQRTATA